MLYVDKDDPPFLIMHGKQDQFIKDAGRSPLLVVVDNADHGFVAKGGTPTPDSNTLDKLLIAFFAEHLR